MKFVISAAGLFLVVTVVTVGTQGRPDTRGDDRRRERFTYSGSIDQEAGTASAESPTEAPTGFDNLTNGMDPQGPAYESLTSETVMALASFNDNRFIFEEVETVDDGLGPTYNAQSCRECHERHRGEADPVRRRYRALSDEQRQLLLRFLDSL